MKILPKNTEIRNHSHLMDAEGTCDDQPTEHEILSYLRSKGYDGFNLQIFFVNMQQTWRWDCDIRKLK